MILDDAKANKKPCSIVVTQPRRIAARSIAERVSNERGWELGTIVGYQVCGEKLSLLKHNCVVTILSTRHVVNLALVFSSQIQFHIRWNLIRTFKMAASLKWLCFHLNFLWWLRTVLTALCCSIKWRSRKYEIAKIFADFWIQFSTFFCIKSNLLNINHWYVNVIKVLKWIWICRLVWIGTTSQKTLVWSSAQPVCFWKN